MYMKKQYGINQVEPRIVKGEIKLPNQEIKVDINAVDNNGQRATINEIINSLKKAAKEQVFPPIVASQNG